MHHHADPKMLRSWEAVFFHFSKCDYICLLCYARVFKLSEEILEEMGLLHLGQSEFQQFFSITQTSSCNTPKGQNFPPHSAQLQWTSRGLVFRLPTRKKQAVVLFLCQCGVCKAEQGAGLPASTLRSRLCPSSLTKAASVGSISYLNFHPHLAAMGLNKTPGIMAGWCSVPCPWCLHARQQLIFNRWMAKQTGICDEIAQN